MRPRNGKRAARTPAGDLFQILQTPSGEFGVAVKQVASTEGLRALSLRNLVRMFLRTTAKSRSTDPHRVVSSAFAIALTLTVTITLGVPASCASRGTDAGPDAGAPPRICHAGTSWAAGKPAFRDATSEWGLDSLHVLGARLAAVDFDGDGWADIVARDGGSCADDPSPSGKRCVWLLRNNHHHGFEDVTAASALLANRTSKEPKGRPAEVMAFGDVNGDGFLDVYTGFSRDDRDPNKSQLETSEVMINRRDGTFALGPADSDVRLPKPRIDVVAGASFVDFDRDGVLDLWVVQNAINNALQQSHLYRGTGDGHFVDVTFDVGLRTKSWANRADTNRGLAHAFGWGAAACDLDGDGNPELLASSYGRAPNLLFQSKGPAGAFAFVNRSVDSGYAFDDRVDWRDNESARCWCKLHPTDADCPGVPAPTAIACAKDSDAFRWNHATDRELYRLGGNNGTTTCADLNNDGFLDLVTSNIVHWDVGSSSDPAEILLNTGEPNVRFVRPGNDVTGLARTHDSPDWNDGIITGSVFDFDNDGWPDVYFGNTDYPGTYGLLFHQDAVGGHGSKPPHFTGVPTAEGIDHHRSHGSAVADFDHDGDLDIVVGHSLARCGTGGDCYPTAQLRFFENVIGTDGNFLQLSLQGGPATNRAAIGARVTVKTDSFTQTQEVGGGHGHYGAQNDLTLHFGLGAACDADVTVRWPDAALSTQTFRVGGGYRYVVVQGRAPEPGVPNAKAPL